MVFTTITDHKYSNQSKIENFKERSSSSGSRSNSSRQKSRREDPLIGETFKSRYKAKKLLGRGSYGRVFLVFDEIEKNEYFNPNI